jgi:tRNA-specific adenosine deaminase 1
MKCLPAAKLPLANGVGLHDWHAEVLAIRAFNRVLLEECRRLARDDADSSSLLRLRRHEERHDNEDNLHQQSFALKDGILLHMYCSEAPCMWL